MVTVASPQFEMIRVLESKGDGPYDEETFAYFLSLEQARATRAGQPLCLLTARLGPAPEAQMPPRVAASIHAALRQTLRDTDVIGWQLKGVELAAALSSAPADLAAFATRVERSLAAGLKPAQANALRVSVSEIDRKR